MTDYTNPHWLPEDLPLDESLDLIRRGRDQALLEVLAQPLGQLAGLISWRDASLLPMTQRTRGRLSRLVTRRQKPLVDALEWIESAVGRMVDDRAVQLGQIEAALRVAGISPFTEDGRISLTGGSAACTLAPGDILSPGGADVIPPPVPAPT